MEHCRRTAGIPLPGLATAAVAVAGLLIGWMTWEAAEAERREEALLRQEEAVLRDREAFRDPQATSQQRIRSIEALVQEGQSCLPELLAELHNPHRTVRQAVAQVLSRIHPVSGEAVEALVELFEDPHEWVRDSAGAGLHNIARDDPQQLVPHLPRLVRRLEVANESEQEDVLLVLRRSPYGPEVVAELHRLTDSERPEVRRLAVQFLRRLRIADAESLAAAHRLLQDPDPGVRDEAFRTLLSFGDVSRDEALQALDSHDESIHSAARAVLEFLGAEAAPAVERLRGLLQSGGRVEPALDSLAAIGPAAEAAVPDVLDLLRNMSDGEEPGTSRYDQGHLQGTIFRCLARISRDEALVVSTLRDGLFSSNSLTSRFAGEALRSYSPQHAREAVPDLVAALNDREPSAAIPLLTALGGLGPESAVALPRITPLVSFAADADSSPDVGYYAIQSIGRMGPAAERAVPALAAELQRHIERDSYWGIRGAALALYHIGARSPLAERLLIEFIERDRPVPDQSTPEDAQRESLVRYALVALGRVGSGSETAYDAICRGVQRPEEPNVIQRWNQHRLWALADVQVRPDDTVATLVEALRDDGRANMGPEWDIASPHWDPYREGIPQSHRHQLIAIRGLGRFPQCADQALPVLIEVVSSGAPDMRVAAALALGELGPGASAAASTLRDIADDPANRMPYSLKAGGAWTPIWTEPLPDPVWDFPSRLLALSLADVARSSLRQITQDASAAARSR